MTLFGVGFKVEVKAAAETNADVAILWKNGSDERASYFVGATELVAYFSINTAPTSADEEFMISGNYKNVSGATTNWFAPFAVTVKKDTGKIVKGTVEYDSPYEIATVSLTTEKNAFKTAQKGGTTNYKAIAEFGGEQYDYDDEDITCYKITPKATYKDDTSTAPTVTFSSSLGLNNGSSYMFAGESDTFTATPTNLPVGMVADYWKNYGHTSTGYRSNGTYTLDTSSYTGALESNIYANYDVNPDATLTFSPDLEGAYLAKGKTTNINRTFTLGGGYKGTNIDSLYFKISDTETVPVTTKTIGPNTTGAFYFTVPTDTKLTAGSQKLIVEMKDGMIYEIPVNIVDPTAITVSLTPDPKNISLGDTSYMTASVTPNISGTIKYDYSFKTTNYDQYVKATKNENRLELEGLQERSGIKVTAKAILPVEGLDKAADAIESAQATINVTTPTFDSLSTIYVNEGLTIPLSKFINNGSGGGINVSNVSSSGGYITSATTLPALAKNVNIKGDKATNLTSTSDVSVTSGTTTKTAKVEVYPKPTLKMDTTGSGSSMKYKFEVTMPDKAYHGSTVGSSISKAKIKFVGKDGTYKMDAFDLKDDTSGYTKKNKDDVTIDFKKLREVFNDICKEDSEEVEVYVYADGDGDIISDKKTLKVYKIRLDGSAGADYKVLGESVSDKFYAIKDKSYEISSTPKSGYSGNPTKWDGVSFGTNSSGSASFSESKTVKAYYNGGATTPTPTPIPNPNGYDDNPQTGESRADIWILWSVLLVSILGAGFMIWKRFGLVRAIAAADQEMAQAQEKERVEAEKKAEKDKMDMLKDLRNL